MRLTHSSMMLAFFFCTTALDAPGQEVGRASGHEGVEIAYEVVSEGSTTLVFVHGWMCDRTFWRNQASRYATTHGVVLLDLGGHGDSGSGRSTWSIASFAQDVTSVIEALDLESVVLVGHSMGGPVIAEAALLEPTRIRGLVGVDTYQYLEAGWLDGNGVPNLVARLERNFEGTAQGFVQSMFTPTSDSILVAGITETMLAGSPSVGVPSTQSMFEWYRDSAVATLNRVRQPIWTINSSEYVGTDVQQVQRLVPGLRVHLMEAVGHFLMLESPDEFNGHLDRALVAVAPGDY